MFKTETFPILQNVCRCLLLHLLRFFCLFRTWSFTLCKNDLDRNDNSDSASAWEFVSSFSITNRSACCELTTGLTVLSYFSVCGLRGVWLSYLVFPGLSDAVEDSATGVLSLHRETKFIIGFDFAVTLSSPESFCVLFAIVSEHTVELKWLILNKHNKWLHSSRVKFPFVKMSAIWFLVSMYAQCSTRSRLWVLKVSCKIGVLKQSQPALFCSITHITILFIFTCVMDVRYQTIQSFVTSFGPFRDRSCKFVHWP